MKIVGLTYYEGQYRMAMKSDSSLLNQSKPFFLPDWSDDIRVNRCIALRINRLGRSIEPRYATRYYDTMALGLDFQAYDLLGEGKVTEALAFDGALSVGKWLPVALFRTVSDTLLAEIEQVCPIEQTVAEISNYMTLRMGDILYIDAPQAARPVKREEEFCFRHDEQPLIYCRIK